MCKMLVCRPLLGPIKPFSQNNRILGFILNYDIYHADYLVDILHHYLGMCEAGMYIYVTVFVVVCNNKPIFKISTPKGGAQR